MISLGLIEILLIGFVLALFLVKGFAATTAKVAAVATGGCLLLAGIGVAIFAGVFTRSERHVTAATNVFVHDVIPVGNGQFVHVNRRMPALMPVPPVPPMAPAAPPIAARPAEIAAAALDPQVARAEVAGSVPDDIARAGVVEATAAIPNRPRPAWVDEKASRVGDDYFVTVHVGPFAGADLLRREVPKELTKASRTFIDEILPNDAASRRVQLPYAYLHDEVVQEEYEEPYVSPTVGLEEMVQLHLRLKFGAEAKKMARQMHRETQIRERLTYAGGGFGGIMILLGTLFSYLKLDNATRGYYSGRLKLAAGTVILAVVTGAVYVVRGGLGWIS